MRVLLQQLLAALDSEKPVAYCRLVETRGSTPQKAGATMLVFADGSQAGTLGGGCVEAEVRRRALDILQRVQAEVVSFQLDSDYGWDDGLICGGRMQVLIDPLVPGAALDYYRSLIELIEGGQGAAEIVVFDSEKSSLNAPSCYLFDAVGRFLAHRHGQLADGQPPPAVAERCQTLVDRPRPSADHGMAFLPILPRCRLLIVGGGHVGQAVGNMAPDLDFEVTVVDDRETYVSRERFPRAERLLCGDISRTLRDLDVDSNTYCLIVTRGHNHDEEALLHLAERGARYVGMIGSKRKIKLIFDDLLEAGISAESLAKVHAPLGIEIGSQTVPEIAISILAELIAHRNLGGQVPGRPEPIGIGLS